VEDVTWQAYGGEKPDLSEKSVTTMGAAQLNVGRFRKKQKSALTPNFTTPPEPGIVKFTSRPRIFAGR
jgi:hypothetical protein